MSKGLAKIIDVITTLLGPNGCPWDKQQTPQTLCDYLIEECFELVEAIQANEIEDVKEELGDVFFLLLLIIHLYQDKINLDEVLIQTAAKMIGRHPHVFGDKKTEDINEILANWEKIKKQELQKKSKPRSIFDSIPKNLPPLLKAYRINSKAARSNFTWPDNASQEQKLEEEWKEWLEAKAQNDPKQMEEEFGDYLFCLTEYARRHGIKPNTALHQANQKFLARFKIMEELAQNKNLDLDNLNLNQLNQLWEEAKQIAKSNQKKGD